MADILLCDESFIKQLTPISGNITITTPMKSAILDAQIRYIKPLIRNTLYDLIQSEIALNIIEPRIQILIDMIRPSLAYYAVYLVLPFNWAKIREVGSVNQLGERTQVIDIKALTYLRGELTQSAETYAIYLSRYLDANVAIYPEWVVPEPIPSPKHWNPNRYFSNI